MPTYVYKCKNCDEEVEVFQKITDEKINKCEKCECINGMERIPQKTSFELKGKGYYKSGLKV